MPTDLDAFVNDLNGQINATLEEILPSLPDADPIRLVAAMRESVLGGGKRLRPCLVIAACQACGGTILQALRPACALELIHAYSLIHDDLPAMDNSDLRRGKPTCHKQFGETTAILAGDALLTLAFEVLASCVTPHTSVPMLLAACAELARASGFQGMVGGQALDMDLKQVEPTFETLERCNSLKTAALFSASTVIGGLIGGASLERLDILRQYGSALGLAFQYADDLQDADFVMHRERSIQRGLDLASQAQQLAQPLGSSGTTLCALGAWVEQRIRKAIVHAVSV